MSKHTAAIEAFYFLGGKHHEQKARVAYAECIADLDEKLRKLEAEKKEITKKRKVIQAYFFAALKKSKAKKQP